MDVEETKKIIKSKIEAEAEAVTKNVRSKIKSYIHEKQNLREGFKKFLNHLLNLQDKVKESIDNQQNAMIKQLQKNQLALTEGLDKNRFSITQGFDKMDEIKKWDLQQLPGYEAIEEPEETEETEEKETEEVSEDENTQFRISFKDLNKIIGHNKYTQEGETKIKRKDLVIFIEKYSFLNQNKYEIKIVDPNTRLLKVVEKPIFFTYDKDEINKNLLNKESIDLLHFLNLKLPSEYKNTRQEFSQIAHLLNQMKVITKKQLNDLLKKYILNK